MTAQEGLEFLGWLIIIAFVFVVMVIAGAIGVHVIRTGQFPWRDQ